MMQVAACARRSGQAAAILVALLASSTFAQVLPAPPSTPPAQNPAQNPTQNPAQPPSPSLATGKRPPGGDPLPEFPLTPLEKVEIKGTGTIPLVLIPDFNADHRMWDTFLERNQTRYKMFAVTLPGMSGTTAPAPLPADAYFSDGLWTRNAERALIKLLDDNNIDRAYFIGHYYGGHLAIRMALMHPDRVAGAISLNGTATVELPSQSSPRFPREHRESFVAATWEAGSKVSDEKFFARQKDGMLKSVGDSARGEYLVSLAQGSPKSVMLHYLAEYNAADLWPQLSDLKVPLAVFAPIPPVGDAGIAPNKALKAKWNRWFLSARHNCEVIWFENCLPMITESAPFELDRAVHAFVYGNFVPGRSSYSQPLTEYKAPEEGGPPETPRPSNTPAPTPEPTPAPDQPRESDTPANPR
ncbi:MAG: hypothetical protein AMXMBFR58_28420 [Phycisphaerae bacterium]